MQKSE